MPRALIFGLLLLATGAPAPALAVDAGCPRPLRVAVLDFDETPRKPQGVGMTALQTAVATAVGIEAEVPTAIRAYPYVRALRQFRRGDADALVIAEGAGRRAVPEATRIPMMRLLFVRVGVEGRATLPAAADLGTLNGMVLPPGAVRAGEDVQTVTNYDALLRQLTGGRVNQILGARPSIDAYLADHPQVSALLGPMAVVAEQPMALHLRPDLTADCLARLASAAARVVEHDMPRIFRRTAPGIDPAPFLLGAVGHAPESTRP